jgi:hypothetical protein
MLTPVFREKHGLFGGRQQLQTHPFDKFPHFSEHASIETQVDRAGKRTRTIRQLSENCLHGFYHVHYIFFARAPNTSSLRILDICNYE